MIPVHIYPYSKTAAGYQYCKNKVSQNYTQNPKYNLPHLEKQIDTDREHIPHL